MTAVKQSHYIEVNGIDIYYERCGNPSASRVLVLLHGFLSSSFSYRRLIPLLENDYYVISIDLPPFGKSGKTNSFHYSYKNIAATVVELVRSIDARPVCLVGHSMGGQICLNIMKQVPEFADKAVLLCSSSYLPRAKRPLIMTSYLPLFHRFIKYHLSRTGVRGNIENVVFDHRLIDEDMINGYMEPFHDARIFSALTRMLRHREGDLPPNDLQAITAPCLLIWGEHDRVVPLSVGKRLAADLSSSELIIIPNAGHLIPEEKPKEIHTRIRHFLTE